MRARTLALTLILAPALVGAEPSRATIPRQAKALAARGRAAHDAGDYGEAILAYKEAYELAPSPSLLFNLAQAYRLAGNCYAAVQMYRQFIAAGGKPEVMALARTHLATVEQCADRPVPPVAPEPELPPEYDATTLPVERPGQLQRRVGVGLVVGGAIAVGFAGYYALDAHDASETVETSYARGVRWQQVSEIAANGERSATIAKSLGIAGGLALASGVTLYVLGRRAERAAMPTVVPTRGGAEVSWGWRF